MLKLLWLWIIVLTEYNVYVSSQEVLNPYFQFTGGSDPFMGILVTVAVPVEAGTPGEVLLSTLLEANYVIPSNQTRFTYPPDFPTAASGRMFLYELFKRKIEDFGFSGKNCLLRAICESAQMSSQHTGLLGDILHILLTPSSSKMEEELVEYQEAEHQGKQNTCEKYYKKCPHSILDSITRVTNIVDYEATKYFSKNIVKLF
ncbi:uncharacterized protein [Diabrotica undecimpunctata]|uniref:uncharacterized protein n=1 Tax=Diabrotica undecimpunctata TaxID=50387 RepID=UPI003B63D6E1